jgi:hypothetical protein
MVKEIAMPFYDLQRIDEYQAVSKAGGMATITNCIVA